jgi:hypothetical protein
LTFVLAGIQAAPRKIRHALARRHQSVMNGRYRKVMHRAERVSR